MRWETVYKFGQGWLEKSVLPKNWDQTIHETSERNLCYPQLINNYPLSMLRMCYSRAFQRVVKYYQNLWNSAENCWNFGETILDMKGESHKILSTGTAKLDALHERRIIPTFGRISGRGRFLSPFITSRTLPNKDVVKLPSRWPFASTPYKRAGTFGTSHWLMENFYLSLFLKTNDSGAC